MIGVCTDSNSQMPADLVARLGAEVVPLTVTIDGVDYSEGVDVDADEFWKRFSQGSPTVTTAAPSPARFLEAWGRLVRRGAEQIVSVHVGSNVSGTLNAAQLAARSSPVPVRLVDTGTASFAVAFAAWAAAERAGGGADVDGVAEAAASIATRCGNVFVVGTLELARAGGRLAPGTTQEGTAVLALVDGQIRPVAGYVDSAQGADIMAKHVLLAPAPLRVAIGTSDESSVSVAEALEDLLTSRGDVEVVRYRIGPSVGAHTGPGTAGAVFHSIAES